MNLRDWLQQQGIDATNVNISALQSLINSVPEGNRDQVLERLALGMPTNLDPSSVGAWLNAHVQTAVSEVQGELQNQAKAAQASVPVNQPSSAPVAAKQTPQATPAGVIGPYQAPDQSDYPAPGPGPAPDSGAPKDVNVGAQGQPSQTYVPHPPDPADSSIAAYTPNLQFSNVRDLASSTDDQDFKTATGQDPKQAYSDYVGSFGDGGRRGTPQPYAQWIQHQNQVAMGPAYAAIKDLQIYYRLHYGKDMPQDLIKKSLDYLRSNPAAMASVQSVAIEQSVGPTAGASGQAAPSTSDQAIIAQDELTRAGASVLSAVPYIGQLISDSGPANEQAIKSQWMYSMTQKFYQQLGRTPNPGELDSLWGQSDIQIQSYMNGQTVYLNGQPSHLNYGQMSAGQSLANSIWNQYFTGAPTQSDITMMAGMTSNQAHEWALKQPSYISGLNVADSIGISKVAGEIANYNWKSPASPDMVSKIADAAKQKNQY